jgi:hypothetical protein
MFMDFMHRLVSQEQKAKNYRQKLKTLTDQINKHPHKNHKRTKLHTTEQQIWTYTNITT